MSEWRKHIAQIDIIQRCASIKITVSCLSALFLLVFFGTIAQIDQGLYLAQARYFHSWYFLILGFLPFPGAKCVLTILFINLVCVSLIRFVYKWSHIGIILIHVGLLTYFISAYVTYKIVQETNVTLLEGEETNVSLAYHDWELSIWEPNETNSKNVLAYDTKGLVSGDILTFPDLDFSLFVKEYYSNASAFMSPEQDRKEIHINASGIQSFSDKGFQKEPEKNMPGIIFNVKDEMDHIDVLLYGGENRPTIVTIHDKPYAFALRRKRHPLLILIKLDDFEMEKHPGTEIARSYKSHVRVMHEGLERRVLIYMNHPLRLNHYTFYQASYSIDQLGRQRSTLAVVKNKGWLMPYISATVTFLGLIVHFLTKAFSKKNRVNHV